MSSPYENYVKELKKKAKDEPRGENTLFRIEQILKSIRDDVSDVILSEPRTVHSLLKAKMDEEIATLPVHISPNRVDLEWKNFATIVIGKDPEFNHNPSFMISLCFKNPNSNLKILISYRKLPKGEI